MSSLGAYNGFSIGIGIVGIIVAVVMTSCSRTYRACLVLGPWFNFIIFLKMVLFFILINITSNWNVIFIVEIVIYLILGRLWRYQTRKLIRQRDWQTYQTLNGASVGFAFAVIISSLVSDLSVYYSIAALNFQMTLTLAACIVVGSIGGFVCKRHFENPWTLHVCHSISTGAAFCFGLNLILSVADARLSNTAGQLLWISGFLVMAIISFLVQQFLYKDATFSNLGGAPQTAIVVQNQPAFQGGYPQQYQQAPQGTQMYYQNQGQAPVMGQPMAMNPQDQQQQPLMPNQQQQQYQQPAQPAQYGQTVM